MSATKEPHHHEHELITLVVSSLASAAAAVVVHSLWPQATLIGAAASPVLVAVFAELLRRPVQRLTVRTSVRPAGRLAVDHGGALQEVRVYRARPQWFSALAVALAAFVVGAGGLTVAETLLHRSVAGRDDATTLFGRSGSAQATPVTRPSTTTVVITTTTPTTTTTTLTTTTPTKTKTKQHGSSATSSSSSGRDPAASRRPVPERTSTTPHHTEPSGTSSVPSNTSTTATTTTELPASATP